MIRRALLVMSVLAFAAVLAAQAQEPAKPAAPVARPPVNGTDPAVDQYMIAARYRQLEESLLRIAQKLERTGNPEGRRKAMAILKALDEARRKQVAINLNQLAEDLKKPGLNELKVAIEKGTGVKNDLELILTMLLSDSEDDKKKEKDLLTAMIKDLDKALRDQIIANANNGSGQVDKEQALKAQEIATAQAKKVLDRMKEYNELKKANQTQGDGKDAQGKDGKGDSKDGKADKKDGKEDKKDGKDNKDGKDGKNDSKDKKDGKDDKENKDGKGDGKDGKDSKDGKGDSKDGQDSKDGKSGGKPSQGNPQDGQSGDSKPGDQNDDQQDVGPSRKKVQDANDYQKKAQDKIAKDSRKDAVPDQEEAKKKLEEAKRKLEEILRQIREEETERILADLQRRCEKMRDMQEIVKAGTEKVDQKIQQSSSKTASREEEVAANKLGDKEDEIVAEADKAISIIETEGTAVAFAEVFHQVRNDMAHVSKRLHRADVGPETQLVEQDIITMLTQMIEALKRARQDNQNRSNPGPSGQPPPPGLIDLLAELRLIRSMQLMVNNRTTVWGKRYQGEQAQEPAIIQELRDLANRQDRIYDIMNKLAKGKNQ
jgi:hypothetical protein